MFIFKGIEANKEGQLSLDAAVGGHVWFRAFGQLLNNPVVLFSDEKAFKTTKYINNGGKDRSPTFYI